MPCSWGQPAALLGFEHTSTLGAVHKSDEYVEPIIWHARHSMVKIVRVSQYVYIQY